MSDLKKLRINKVTIRTLNRQEIAMVAGGIQTNEYGICQSPTIPCASQAACATVVCATNTCNTAECNGPSLVGNCLTTNYGDGTICA
jgi:hypothetical protein